MYRIRCGCHTYITLEYDGQFLMCLDNDGMYAEEMISHIEKRTRMKFKNIPIDGRKEDFSGLVFFNGGWKRDFWNEFPSDEEITAYMNMKKGIYKRRS